MQKLISIHKQKPDYNIEICGWSYGGAVALLAAEDFYFRTKIKPDVITFGAPKPLFGNKTKEYVKSCCKNVKQYAHKSDIVSYLPVGYKQLNRVEVGKFKLINLFKPETYHCCYGDSCLYK